MARNKPKSGGAPSNYNPVGNNGGSGGGNQTDWNGGWNNYGAQPTAPPSPPPTTDPVTPTQPGGMNATQQSAWAFMSQQLEQYGLGSLAADLKWLIEAEGITDEGTLTLRLQELPQWKARFAGNEALRAAGLPVLSVAEYLATERSYGQIMKNYGLPSGFYDDPSDFSQFIGGNISARELEQRVSAWSDLANREDPAIKEQLRSMGISDGDLVAYMMDPDRAAPLIQKTYQQALVGGAARTQGLNADGASRLVELGITEREALQGYGVISEVMPTANRLSDIYGEDVDQGDLEGEVFENNGEATRKRKRLASRERAAFQGTSGVGQGSLSRRDNGSY